MQINVVDGDYDSPVAAVLIEEIQQELTVRYGGPDETPVAAGEFAPPSGAFLVVEVDGEPVGCVALRRVSGEDVELKRMYVRADQRRRGLARVLLDAVEVRATELGYRRILLETGLAQPEAMALYEAHGYRLTTGFGHYADEPTSRAYVKTLGATG